MTGVWGRGFLNFRPHTRVFMGVAGWRNQHHAVTEHKEPIMTTKRNVAFQAGIASGGLAILLALSPGCRRSEVPLPADEGSPHGESAPPLGQAPASVRSAVGLAPPAASEMETLARAALERGLDYLVEQQPTNGVWSNADFPALSALPLWALSIANRPRDAEAATRAERFVAGCTQPDGGIYVAVPGRRGGALGTYNTAICMTALHARGNPAHHPLIRKARSYVVETQLLGDDEYRGGFGYEKNSRQPYADLNNTAWALSAMRATQDVEETRPPGEPRVDVDWDAALAFVDKMQLATGEANAEDAGGFMYKPADPNKAGVATNAVGRPYLRSYGSITYSGLLSLIYAQVGRSDPRVVSAVDYARRHWTLDENPGMGLQGLYYYYTIMARSLAATGLAELPPVETGGEPIQWREALIAKLITLQQPDGRWVNSNNRFWENDPILATAYATLAMEYALGMVK